MSIEYYSYLTYGIAYLKSEDKDTLKAIRNKYASDMSLRDLVYGGIEDEQTLKEDFPTLHTAGDGDWIANDITESLIVYAGERLNISNSRNESNSSIFPVRLNLLPAPSQEATAQLEEFLSRYPSSSGIGWIISAETS